MPQQSLYLHTSLFAEIMIQMNVKEEFQIYARGRLPLTVSHSPSTSKSTCWGHSLGKGVGTTGSLWCLFHCGQDRDWRAGWDRTDAKTWKWWYQYVGHWWCHASWFPGKLMPAWCTWVYSCGSQRVGEQPYWGQENLRRSGSKRTSFLPQDLAAAMSSDNQTPLSFCPLSGPLILKLPPGIPTRKRRWKSNKMKSLRKQSCWKTQMTTCIVRKNKNAKGV